MGALRSRPLTNLPKHPFRCPQKLLRRNMAIRSVLRIIPINFREHRIELISVHVPISISVELIERRVHALQGVVLIRRDQFELVTAFPLAAVPGSSLEIFRVGAKQGHVRLV